MKTTRRNNGFGTLEFKGENKPYLARWKFQGKKYSKSTGETNYNKALKKLEEFTRPFRDVNAKEALFNIQAKINSIEEKEKEDKLNSQGILLDDLMEHYNNSIEASQIKSSTLMTYNDLYKTFLKFIKENHKYVSYMKSIDEKIANEFLSYLSNKISIIRFNNTLMLLKKLWDMFADEGRCRMNPFKNFKRLKKDHHTRRVLTMDELYRIMDICDDEEIKVLITLGFYTGMRLSDCCLLKYSSFDIMKKVLNVTQKKTGNDVFLPLNEVLFGLLYKRWMERKENEFILPRMAQLYKNGSVQKHIKNLFNKAGIMTTERDENGKLRIICSFHSLRHTAISNLINANMNPLLVSKFAGHTNMQTTELYVHQNEDVVRKSVNQLPNIIDVESRIFDWNLKETDMDMLRKFIDKDDNSISDVLKKLVDSYVDKNSVISA